MKQKFNPHKLLVYNYHQFDITKAFDKFHEKIHNIQLYIFDSDLLWRMQLRIIKGKKFVFCV